MSLDSEATIGYDPLIPSVNEHVLRLHIAMHPFLIMGRRQDLCELLHRGYSEQGNALPFAMLLT